MRRAVEKYLEDPLAEELLRGNIKQGDTLEAHAAGQQLAFKGGWGRNKVNPATGDPLRSVRRDTEAGRSKVAVAWVSAHAKSGTELSLAALFVPLLQAIHYARLGEVLRRDHGQRFYA